jgi:iduronate 2-sulfatase
MKATRKNSIISGQKNIFKIPVWGLLACTFGSSCSQQPSIPKSPPNILFIAVDDLRPELGCYGNQNIQTPNIDRLAGQGVVFTRAYVQQAICGPSRSSLMTGLRPDATQVTNNSVYFRNTVPDVVTLPQYFIKHGYVSHSIGKIFHGTFTDPENSWSEKPFEAKQIFQAGKRRNQVTISADVPDNAFRDGANAEEAIKRLKLLKEGGKPFFLGVGFHLPHLSWHCPKKYWDLYDPEKIELTGIKLQPQGATAVALHNSYELRNREGVPDNAPISDSLSRHLMHGYYACVSYVDAQVGLLLDELEKSGLSENTIIMLWGDHGWHLGEYGLWGKATNYEIATRAPLIVSVPGMKTADKQSDALVEFVDMYPTLCDLANLPVPEHLQGKSFKELLNDPKAKGKDAVFSQFPSPALREWASLPLDSVMRKKFKELSEAKELQIQKEFGELWNRELFEQYLMGYAMRTDQYRFIRWVDIRNPEKALALELYDHFTDPNETINLAKKPDYTKVLNKLEKQMIENGISVK